ncbi:hypothetical protein [Azoarcus olearius]|uniref:Aspartate ammonia-lyase n=1 Tax=Azoarcus sp. (strain BH72) TaxID=418699 RepID=A1KBY3_AZOSB|nr:hypothetical protein [Azoarcus olearius]CAL96339.1 hypothetical protein predicted by Glimmer/Critica [Azoarcus olearius]
MAAEELQGLSSILVGVSGEYFVAAELSRRGHVASITLRNTRGMDVIATNTDASVSVGIQVKTNRHSKKDWMLNDKCETYHSPNLFYVFVNLVGLTDRPCFHIVPSIVVAERITKSHRAWLASPKRDGGDRKNTSLRRFKDPDSEYLDRWDLLGLDGPQSNNPFKPKPLRGSA